MDHFKAGCHMENLLYNKISIRIPCLHTENNVMIHNQTDCYNISYSCTKTDFNGCRKGLEGKGCETVCVCVCVHMHVKTLQISMWKVIYLNSVLINHLEVVFTVHTQTHTHMGEWAIRATYVGDIHWRNVMGFVCWQRYNTLSRAETSADTLSGVNNTWNRCNIYIYIYIYIVCERER